MRAVLHHEPIGERSRSDSVGDQVCDLSYARHIAMLIGRGLDLPHRIIELDGDNRPTREVLGLIVGVNVEHSQLARVTDQSLPNIQGSRFVHKPVRPGAIRV